MKKILPTVALVSLLLVPVAFAQELPINNPTQYAQNSAGPIQNNIADTIRTVFGLIFRVLLWVAGAYAVIMFILAGILYITGGDENTKTAKSRLINGTIGLVIALVAYAAVQLIARFVQTGSLQ